MDHREGHLQLEETSAAVARGGVTIVERRLLESLLDTAGNPPIRMRLWTGEEIVRNNAPPVATMVIRDRGALMRMLVNPEVNPADDYSDGRIEIEGDLVAFLDNVFRGLDNLPDKSLKARFLRWMNKPRANSLAGSKENIHHHYDLGNDFYKLWLDNARMQYTCAYYPHHGMTIEQAQIAKLDHVARKLELRPGQVVYEAGCGWGGLARHFAQNYGVTVRAYNISSEQVKFAR
jgi:cyclopropane-fatty-acyl-phospholipid synthase